MCILSTKYQTDIKLNLRFNKLLLRKLMIFSNYDGIKRWANDFTPRKKSIHCTCKMYKVMCLHEYFYLKQATEFQAYFLVKYINSTFEARQILSRLAAKYSNICGT